MSTSTNFFMADKQKIKGIQSGELLLNDILEEIYLERYNSEPITYDFLMNIAMGNLNLTEDDVIKLSEVKSNDDFLEIWGENWTAIEHLLEVEGSSSQKKNCLLKMIEWDNFINDEIIGVGPAILISMEETQTISDIIQSLDNDTLKIQCNIYVDNCGILDLTSNFDEFFDEFLLHFTKLKNFFEKAKNEEKCIILFYM